MEAPAVHTRPMLTVQAVAQRLTCSTATVRRLAATGELPHIRIGSLMRFEPADVEQFLEQQRH